MFTFHNIGRDFVKYNWSQMMTNHIWLAIDLCLLHKFSTSSKTWQGNFFLHFQWKFSIEYLLLYSATRALSNIAVQPLCWEIVMALLALKRGLLTFLIIFNLSFSLFDQGRHCFKTGLASFIFGHGETFFGVWEDI